MLFSLIPRKGLGKSTCIGQNVLSIAVGGIVVHGSMLLPKFSSSSSLGYAVLLGSLNGTIIDLWNSEDEHGTK